MMERKLLLSEIDHCLKGEKSPVNNYPDLTFIIFFKSLDFQALKLRKVQSGGATG